MEFLAGYSLRDELEKQPGKRLPAVRVVKIMEDLIKALEAVHKEDIYHLDLKPDNVLLTPEERVVLVDFGAAKQGLGTKSTQAYTPGYAPLEVIAGRAAGAQSDIFELGVMVYEMLTGEMPEWLTGDWKPSTLEEPWRSRVTSALKVRKEERPNSVREWWQSKPDKAEAEHKRQEELERQRLEAEIRRQIQAEAEHKRQEELERQRRERERLEAERKRPYTETLPSGIQLEMIAIPAGSFMMGGTDNDDEKPPHQVKLNVFHIGKYPVTQEQYQAVMGNNPSHFKKGGKYPVEQVSWDDAQAFCQKLSKMTGKTYRLPSEAQWEYACRAGTQTRYYFGDNENQLKEYAWYDANSNSQTQLVGQKKPNKWGLYDMLGNVWEWCEDDWHSNYNGAPTDGRAWIDNDNRSQSSYRIIRGGSWLEGSRGCSCFWRNSSFPARRNSFIGFRLVCVFART